MRNFGVYAFLLSVKAPDTFNRRHRGDIGVCPYLRVLNFDIN